MLRISLRSVLIGLNCLVFVLILIIILFPSSVIRIVLGIPFVLFAPGYTILVALFPRKEAVSNVNRIVLSFGLSIVFVPLIGLILNYTPWGIKLEPVLYSITIFVVLTSIIAWFRQRSLTESERYTVELQMPVFPSDQSTHNKVLTILLGLTILGLLAIVIYYVASPKLGETYTEFYILGSESQEANYPTELNTGDEGRIILAIVNHEKKDTNYRIEVFIGSEQNYEVGPVLLADEEIWEAKLLFIPKVAGENQKVEFFLYKDSEIEPSLGPLYVWVDVVDVIE